LSKSYDVLSDRQIKLILQVLRRAKRDLGEDLARLRGERRISLRSSTLSIDSSRLHEISEIISYFENYNSALNPLDHEQSK
jgi:hypothetical protein